MEAILLLETKLCNNSYQDKIETARDPQTGRFVKGGGHPGRKPGSRNKQRVLSVDERLRRYEQHKGQSFDPIEGLARIAIDESLTARVRLSAWRSLARYIYPQRQAVDVTEHETDRVGQRYSNAQLATIIGES